MSKKIEEILTSDIYGLYSGLLALSDLSLLVAAPDGRILYEFIPSPDFCKYVCQETQETLCASCLAHMNDAQGESWVCEKGLKNIAVPIRDEAHQVIAYVVGSRVYGADTEYLKFLLDLPSMAAERGLETAFAAKTIAMLKTVEDAKITAHEQLCTYIAQSISRTLQMGGKDKLPVQSIEKDLIERRMLDLEAKNKEPIISTHFLFNSLNCIARVAYFEHASQTEELIYNLSDILRYNVQNGDSLHTIQAELDNIEKYLFIQKARFKSRLQYRIEVPESVRSCRIPNMVLQPLVENALLHGIAPKRDGGYIHIEATEEAERVILRVIDNGNGFSAHSKALFDDAQPLANAEGSLGQTQRRIQQYFGTDCGLFLEKSDYSGATLAVTLAKNPSGRGGVNA